MRRFSSTAVVRMTLPGGRRLDAWVAESRLTRLIGLAGLRRLPPGTALDADLHWYPARLQLRALVGALHGDPELDPAGPRPVSVGDALATAGRMVAAEPWLERAPMCVRVTAAPLAGGRWVLTDPTGSLPLVRGVRCLPELVAITAAAPAVVAGEWSADGFLALTAWIEDRVVAL